MAKLVSGWTAGKYVCLAEQCDGGVIVRRVPAKWSLFVTGLDADDRHALARDHRVTGVISEGEYTRVNCRDRYARFDVIAAIERAMRARESGGVELLEADVSPVRRLLSDVGTLEVDPAPRLAFFDLEVDSRCSFADMRCGRARTLSWAAVARDGALIGARVLRADTDDAERELLTSFFDAMRAYDCLIAWNGAAFDFEVLAARIDELQVKPPCPWQRWTWLDHMLVFKKYNMHSDDAGIAKVSYALDHVAGYLLGEGKIDFDASRTWQAWEQPGSERTRLLRYNVHDVRLMQRVEEATGYLSLHLAVCHICRVFPDTESLNATGQGDGFLLRLGAERGYRWPTKVRVEEAERFAGAYVMPPRRLGAVENVHVADFAGLYPSIMRTWNMGLDTKLAGPEEGACRLPGRSTYFRQDTDGMFRVALDRLVSKRAEYQRAMKDHEPGSAQHEQFNRLSKAFKIVANSFYGICGSPYSRFFDVEIAEGVTQTGRWLLNQVIESAEAEGFDPFYGDTDSAFIAGDADEFRKFVGRMNESWGERLAQWNVTGTHYIDLDFEKTFSRLIMVSAKRYAGRFAMYKGRDATDAKPEVKGLEFKRGDTMSIARDMQTEVVLALLGEELPAGAAMWGVVERWRERVLRGELTLKDVVLSQSLSRPIGEYSADYTSASCKKCGQSFGGHSSSGPAECASCGEVRAVRSYPAHVRVALDMMSKGIPVQEGGRVSYLITRDGSGTGLNAVHVDTPGAFENIDREYYWEKRVYPPTQRVLEVVYPDIHWEETTTDRNQRRAETGGQRSLFDATDSRPRRRRRVVTIAFSGMSPNDEEATPETRNRLLAIRAAIEAHPGKVPVVLRYGWSQGDKRVEVTLPTGLDIAETREAHRALERVAGGATIAMLTP